MQGLPSWCPDFNAPMNGAMFALRGQHHAGYTIDANGDPDPSDFGKASCGTQEKVHTPGLTIDTIRDVILPDWSAPIGSTDKDRANARRILEWDAACLGLSRTAAAPSNNQVLEAHWRTLCADQLDTGFGYIRCPSEGATLYGEFKRRLAALAAGEGMGFRSCESFATMIGIRAAAQSFFSTHGRRIGLGPRGAKAGDKVCIFRGGAAPFVLREDTGRANGADEAPNAESERIYNLVGDAYVHGVMYGELYQDVRASDEVFVLR